MKPMRSTSAIALLRSSYLRPPKFIHSSCTQPENLRGIATIAIAGRSQLTLQRREATVHDQFEITQLALGQNDSGEGLGFSAELLLAGSIAGEQVLEDTTVGRVGHYERGSKNKDSTTFLILSRRIEVLFRKEEMG